MMKRTKPPDDNYDYYSIIMEQPTAKNIADNHKALERMNVMELLTLYFLTYGTGNYKGLDDVKLIERINEIIPDKKLTKTSIYNMIVKISDMLAYIDYATITLGYYDFHLLPTDQEIVKRLVRLRLGYLPDVWKHRRWSKERKQRHSEIMKTSWKKRKQ